MTSLLLFVVVGVAIGFARGGSLRNFAHARLRGLWILWVGIAMQVLANSLPASAATWAFVVVIASYGAVAAFAAMNWRRTGMLVIVVGAALNFIVIAANQGMPVSRTAVAEVGYPTDELHKGKHKLDCEGRAPRLIDGTPDCIEPRLRFLSDIIVWQPLRPPIVSVGDVFILAGITVLVQGLMLSRSEPGPTPEPAAATDVTPG